MFSIFCDTIAVNMNLGDQANLAALLRSLVWGGKERKMKTHKRRRPAACSMLTEVLLLLQRPLSEACSLLIIQFAGCCTALRVLCPQPSVIAYHFTFFHVWPCLSLLLILSIFSWDNQPQCCSLWPREALPPHLTHLLKSPAFQHRDPNPATMTEHSQPVGPVCLTSNQKQPGWVCQHSVCCAWLFIMNGKFCKNCPFSEPWSQLACVLANECFSVFLDLMLLLSLPSVCQRDCQMNVKMENYWQWPSYFEVFFLAFYILMWCNRLKQLTVCHHVIPSVTVSASDQM